MRWFLKTVVALALFMLVWTPVAACSPAPFEVRVTCPGEAPVRVFGNENVLQRLSPACAAALDSEVIQMIADYEWRDKDFFNETHFSVSPWTVDGENQLRDQERHLFGCAYQRWQRVGDWLVSQDSARSYCGSPPHMGGSCPVTQVSLVQFMGFALVNPAPQIWPYTLAAWLILLSAGFGLAHLLRHGQLAAFLRPGRLPRSSFCAISRHRGSISPPGASASICWPAPCVGAVPVCTTYPKETHVGVATALPAQRDTEIAAKT